MHRFVFLVRFLTVGERARILPYPPVAKRASPVSCLRKNPPIDRRQGRSADWQIRSRKSRHDGLIKRNLVHDHLLHEFRTILLLSSRRSLLRITFFSHFVRSCVIRAMECSIRDNLATKIENRLECVFSLIKDLVITVGSPTRTSYFRHLWWILNLSRNSYNI